MQSTYIAPVEWRWLILVATGLVLLAFAPFLWVALGQTPNGTWQFMGALHAHIDSAAYLARIKQGVDGNWLTYFFHTPEPHPSALTHMVYTLVGQLTRLTPFSPVVMFHIVRVAASVFMYIAIYQLGASIWAKVRARRVFFIVATLASGLGWLWIIVDSTRQWPDLTVPQLSPFLSTVVNIHYPLAISFLAMLAAILITAFRPGATQDPNLQNGGVAGFLLSLALSFTYPEALLPITLAMGGCLLAAGLGRRQMPIRELRWALWVTVPALPVIAYNFATLQNNPAVREWAEQSARPAPAPWILLLTFLGLLFLAAPALWRALRRFEPDGDRFMVLWFAMIIFCSYLPIPFQHNFGVGWLVVVSYFITRAAEDVWLNNIPRPWRYRLFALLLPFLALSNLLALFLPIVPIIEGEAHTTHGMVIEPDYRFAFNWLAGQTRHTDVILASPDVSPWIPVWVGARVVYGHPTETMDASLKRGAVLRWFALANPEQCAPLLNGAYSFRGSYRVNYILYGPRERALGTTICLNELQFVASFGGVDIYTRRPIERLP